MRILNWLNKPVRPQLLGLFRIFFGIIMLWDIKRIHDIKLIESFYAHDIIFPYEFLNLPLPGQEFMNFLMGVLFISTILITLGVFYRYAMAVFAVGFSYFFFLDQVLYNNHLYMISLLSFMMIFMPADTAFSLSKKRRRSTIPQWSIRLLQFQVVVVYFFGGIVKLNPYWLNFHPVDELLHAAASRTGSSFLLSDTVKYLFTYGGIAFDLLIGALLWMPKTRKVAIILAVFFNLTNSMIFNDIFIFPFFMICALMLFIDPEKAYNWFKRKNLLKKDAETAAGPIKKIGVLVIGAYVLFQLAMPLRHYFIPGYTDWTGEGQRFSWRMKIQHRKIEENVFAIMDLDKKVIHEIEPKDHLFPDEIQQMCNSPQMILQFAEYLNDVIAPKNGIHNCWIKSKVKVSFNGKPAAYIFDPAIDLVTEARSGKPVRTFIEPEPSW